VNSRKKSICSQCEGCNLVLTKTYFQYATCTC
jgi:hypothetical protein